MHPVVTQCHKIDFKNAAFVTELCTLRDKTQLDSNEHSVLQPGSGTCCVDFGMLAKVVVLSTVDADKWHSDFTPSEQCALHSFKGSYAIKRFNSSLEMKTTFSFEYPIYANSHYAINCTVFL